MLIHSGNDKLSLESILDPEGMLYYSFYLKPPIWEANKEYIKGDIISPSTPTGYYYLITSSGVSGLTEPVSWSSVKGAKTEDNTVIFKAVDNNAYLTPNSSLSSATFVTTEGVPTSNVSYTPAGMATVQLGPVPVGVTSFELTLSITVSSGHATSELDDRTIKIEVGQR